MFSGYTQDSNQPEDTVFMVSSPSYGERGLHHDLCGELILRADTSYSGLHPR